MDAKLLSHTLSDLAVSKTEFAALVGVTTRAVNLWTSGEREVPGPAAAYLRLFQSLPMALRVQELARVREGQMEYSGMYSVEFSGPAGQGICALVLMDGYVFGHDGGVQYDGTYAPNQADPAQIDLNLKLTVPPGVELVQGVPAQPVGYWFPLSVSIPARGTSTQSVSTPYGPPIQCTIRYLRAIPGQLAA
jgi:hypothetical protein